jgi:ribA/ribD-fused uncharacterized protein
MALVKTFYDPKCENGFLAIGYEHQFFCGTLSALYGYGINIYCMSAEIAFLAWKFPQFAGQIINSRTSSEARRIVNGQIPISNWRENQIEMMLSINLDKFANRELNRMLMNTHNAELIKLSEVDLFWGSAECTEGRNILGKILMGIRSIFNGMTTREIILAQIR